MGILPEFEDFFVSYGSYHHDLVNKWIHIFCIPCILVSATCMLNFVPWSLAFEGEIYEFNINMIILTVLSLVYLKVETTTGILCTVIYFSAYFYYRCLYLELLKAGNMDGVNAFWKCSLITHIVCWLAQFVGHGAFEGRNPALMDNLLLTFVAPDFVFIELLFMLGWKRDSFKRCEKKIIANIEEFRRQKEIKSK